MLRRYWLISLSGFVVSLSLYLLLPSSAYNGDGLRVLVDLHRVAVDSTGKLSYEPKHWSAAYQPVRYLRTSAGNHLLFPLYAQAAYRIAGHSGYQGDGVRPLQIANALMAAITIGLILGLLVLAGMSSASALLVAAGLTFSTAYSSMATNVAEVVPTFPWIVLGLLFLSRRNFGRGDGNGGRMPADVSTLLSGVALGIGTGFYLSTALIALALAIVQLIQRHRRRAVLLLSAFVLTAAAIYVGTLWQAGYHRWNDLWRTITLIPTTPHYGVFRLRNLLTAGLGFANSLLPVLPEDFAGLRPAFAGGFRFYPWMVSAAAVLVLAGLLFYRLFARRRQLRPDAGRLIVPGLAVFGAMLAGSLSWNPYHAKFWACSNIGFWLIVAGGLQQEGMTDHKPLRRLLVVGLVAILVLSNLVRLINQAQPNPKNRAVHQLAGLTAAPAGKALVVGDWDYEFSYLAGLLPEENVVVVPDWLYEAGGDFQGFEQRLRPEIHRQLTAGQPVYFVNLFSRSPDELRRSYEPHTDFGQFALWLDSLQRSAILRWHDTLSGTSLHQLQ